MKSKKNKVNPKKVRKEVEQVYAQAISKEDGNCCGSLEKSCCSTLAVAKNIGYSEEDLANFSLDSGLTSFGCGNPLAYSEVREGETVLDLGMGAGLDLLIASRKVGPSGRVIGVDMTEEMIERAKKNIKTAGVTNVEVCKGLIEDLPVDSSSVDWVISNCVINLSPEKEKVFSEIARVLKPGGRMVISDIIAEDLPEWMYENKKLYCSCVSGAISEKKYLSGLHRAGLEQVKVNERQVYKSEDIESFIQSSDDFSLLSEIKNIKKLSSEEALKRIAKELNGKVASVKIFARKPVF
jgi:ubiquinone/menaquinone biosynthesis C-methylase UbiE